MKFILNGCDISFYARAPDDITLKQLLKQCDKIKPHWCVCGIRSADEDEIKHWKPEIKITYDSVEKVDKDTPCTIIDILDF